MDSKDLEYFLPKDLIAQDPIPERDHSRLMVVDRTSGTIEHRHFLDLAEYLHPTDVLVCNDTRVIPARLLGKRSDTGGKVELLLLSKHSSDSWYCLVHSGSRVKVGSKFVLGDTLRCEIVELCADGRKIARFFTDEATLEGVIESIGIIPLPPYIINEIKDPERYQTIYSKWRGSVASPTAGLHFTETMMNSIRDKGTQIEFITLHIGLDTFKLIKEPRVDDHPVFREFCSISSETANVLSEVRQGGGRIFAVGTTVTRTLESSARQMNRTGNFAPFSDWTDIFIVPGHKFLAIDALVTNFHLPRSTPLSLVSAFAGLELARRAYQEAIKNRYRFYSFGDAMLII
jgi:S-adenosylmethionine:tRNA ribosyltransferase-isomerase